MIGLCERFHCLPSQLLAESADLLRMLNIYELAHPSENGGEP